MKKCKGCEGSIPEERMEALPDTEYCVNCAETQGSTRKGFMVYSHKTAPELIMVDSSNTEDIRQATRASKRSR